MKKIDRLTPEQERRLIEWREEWLRIGTCTDPCDRAPIEAAVTAMYARIGKPSPRIIWTNGPATTALLVAFLRQSASLGASLRASLWASLGASLGDSLRDSLGASLWASLGASLRDSLWASLGASLRASLGASLGASLRASLGDSLGASLRDSLRDLLGGSLGDSLQWWGQQEAYWVAYYLYCVDVLSVRYDPQSEADLSLWATMCRAGWWCAFDGVAILAERPAVQLLDDRGVIHCDDGPAIRCRDGFEVYAIHGVRVPQKVVTEPQNITVAEIKAEQNAEVRRVMRERFGEGRYLLETGAKVIAADHETARKGSAPRCLVEDSDGQRFLVGTDGSTERTYYMRTRNDVTTCRAAHESLSGFPEDRVVNKS